MLVYCLFILLDFYFVVTRVYNGMSEISDISKCKGAASSSGNNSPSHLEKVKDHPEKVNRKDGRGETLE